MDILKAVLLREAIDEIVTQGMGIHRYCLQDLVKDVDQVVDDYRLELSEVDVLFRAEAGVRELVQRMASSARERSSENLSETDRLDAKSRCGIIFICRPPRSEELLVR